MRNFGVCDELAVPVDIITGLTFDPPSVVDYDSSAMTVDKVSGALIVETEEGDHRITDAEMAKRFIRSLESSTNIQGAYADDLIRQIDEHLT